MFWTIGISIVLYLCMIGFIIYITMIVDSETSPVAYYCTITIPQTVWRFIQRIIPSTILSILILFVDRSMMIGYIIILLVSWIYIFIYVFPWINSEHQTLLSNYHKYTTTFVFIMCIYSFKLVHTSNPGIITKNNLYYYNHYSYDNIMFISNQLCKTTNVPKLARSKFDKVIYQQNIAKYDHFCGWVYNIIGEDNYRYFLLYLLCHILMLAYGSYCFTILLYNDIIYYKLWNVTYYDKLLHIEIESSYLILFQYIFQQYFIEVSLLIICIVMGIPLLLFLLYHCYLVSYNITTNESSKWDIINKWYNNELKLYNNYLIELQEINTNQQLLLHQQQQQQQQQSQTQQHNTNNNDIRGMPTIGDTGDVTCLGTRINYDDITLNQENDNTITTTTTTTTEVHTNSSSTTTTNSNINEYTIPIMYHPGPKPINIYNKGFIQNWKEVLFPQSLQKLKQYQKENQQKQQQQRIQQQQQQKENKNI